MPPILRKAEAKEDTNAKKKYFPSIWYILCSARKSTPFQHVESNEQYIFNIQASCNRSILGNSQTEPNKVTVFVVWHAKSLIYYFMYPFKYLPYM